MKVNDYPRVLETAKKELADLQGQRTQLQSQLAEIDRRIEKQKKGITGLAHLADQQTMAALPIGAVTPLAKYKSFTDAISYALKTVRTCLVPTQVRDRLLLLGYDLKKYKSDPVASIHTILKRLEFAGRVRSERNDIGKTAYRWVSEEERLETILGPTSFALGIGEGAVERLPMGEPDDQE
jgi:hypothetical protein